MQAGNNENIASLGVETVQVCSVVDVVQRLLTLHDVTYAHEIMYNVISIFNVRKRKFIITIHEDECHPGMGKVEVFRKPS